MADDMDTFNPFEKEDDGEEGEAVLPDVSSYPKENSDFYFNSMLDFISWASCSTCKHESEIV